MKISAISDVHIKTPFDQADQLFCRFLKNPDVINSDYILLLGDIFDLMCGPHQEYLDSFQHIFDLLEGLQQSNHKILYHEGNHDLHLKQLFKLRWPRGEIVPMSKPEILLLDGKQYYISHGDEHDLKNYSYHLYKFIITSFPLKLVADYLMPIKVLNFLGQRASILSRKRGSKTYNFSSVKEKFRKGVIKNTKGQYHFILGGHSHVEDLFKINQDSIYVNNGYAQKTKTFIYIEDHAIHFKNI